MRTFSAQRLPRAAQCLESISWRACQDPKLLGLMIPSLGTLNKARRTAWLRRQRRLPPPLPDRRPSLPSRSPSRSNSDRRRRYRIQSKPLKIIVDILYRCAIIVSLNRHDSRRFRDHAFPPRGPCSFVKTTGHSRVSFLHTRRSRNPFGCNT